MIKYLLFIIPILSSDINLGISNRSMNLLYNLLPNIKTFVVGQCLENLGPFKINYIFSFTVNLDYICINDIDFIIDDQSIEILGENKVKLIFPYLNLQLHTYIKIQQGLIPSLGKVDIDLKNIQNKMVIVFNENQDGSMSLQIEDIQLSYEKISLQIENGFMEFLWYVLLNHDFMKKYVIKNILEDFQTKAEKINLKEIIEFEIQGKKQIFGLDYLPQLEQKDDQHFIYMYFSFYQKHESKKQLQLSEVQPLNMFFTLNLMTLNFLALIYQEKLEFNLNDIESLKDKLNVDNISILFPGLKNIFPNNPEKIIKVDLKFDFPKGEPIKQRDYNLFIFSDLIIKMRDPENDQMICQMQLDSYLNLMINSSQLNPSKLYFNLPNLRIKDLQVQECQFEVIKENYINTLQNLFRVNLIGINSIDTSIMKKFFEGPYIYIQENKMTIGTQIAFPF